MNLEQTNILQRCVSYLSRKGIVYVDTPFIVSQAVVRSTHEGESLTLTDGRCIQGSVEQGLLSVIDPDSLGCYMSFGPCARIEETYDIYTKECFYQLEVGSYAVGYSDIAELIKNMYREVFSLGRLVFLEDTEEGVDLMSPDLLELGSYGVRENGWNYGTGVAFPRVTQARGLGLLVE